ncbi:MAG TPA: thioredoxin family protein [Polyangiaceae bacterium]|jgi:thiol:disulfide interchange protein
MPRLYPLSLSRPALLAPQIPLLLALGTAACAHRAPIDRPIPESGPVPFIPPDDYPEINWVSSLEEGQTVAADQHKPIVLFVRAAWSRPAVIMDSTIWNDGRVRAEARRFICIRIDRTSEYGKTMPDALKTLTVEGVPTTVVIASDGHVTGRFVAGAARATAVADAMREAK